MSRAFGFLKPLSIEHEFCVGTGVGGNGNAVTAIADDDDNDTYVCMNIYTYSLATRGAT